MSSVASVEADDIIIGTSFIDSTEILTVAIFDALMGSIKFVCIGLSENFRYTSPLLNVAS